MSDLKIVTEINVNNCVKIGNYEFIYDQYGFLKQKDPISFTYDCDYKYKQSTNILMSGIRLGWLLSQIPAKKLAKMIGVDIGCGNGCFVKEAAKVMSCVPYDLAGESIGDLKLYATHWDIVFLSDVLEHYDDIDKFWGLDFTYAMISYPETPDFENIYDLEHWRHFKPNEHIYMLKKTLMKKWFEAHNCEVIAYGNPEDSLRKPWDCDFINISTFLIKRNLLK